MSGRLASRLSTEQWVSDVYGPVLRPDAVSDDSVATPTAARDSSPAIVPFHPQPLYPRLTHTPPDLADAAHVRTSGTTPAGRTADLGKPVKLRTGDTATVFCRARCGLVCLALG